ncbi:hypothetical protein VZT92_017285 [Zoarces viviparus]|uniref:C1q domain-containing protein n=1 Tax=Zoarces viviparus TaxID=48416 RepID=A0AAW1ERN8_ZOAVI
MENFSVMMAVCLLAGLSECQTGATQPSCNPLIYTVLKELGALGEKLAATARALEETNKRLEASEKKLSALENSAEYQGRPRIAFSATFSTDVTIGPVTVLYALVYNHVLFNTGGHYSPVTGYFTAPVQGVYYFTFTSFCWSGSSGGGLYRNGNSIVSWYGNLNSSSRSNSAILQLQVGDHVNVRLWENQKISGHPNNYSTFSGFLIFPV